MAVSKRLRYEVLRRDQYRCRYCGATAATATLTIDHVTPVALGGKDEMANLVTACEPCNAGKTSTAPDVTISVAIEATAPIVLPAIKHCVYALLADHPPTRLTLPADPQDDLTIRNAVGMWFHAWGRSSQVDPPEGLLGCFHASVAHAIGEGHSAPVLYGAAELAGCDEQADVLPFARAVRDALTVELERARISPAVLQR